MNSLEEKLESNPMTDAEQKAFEETVTFADKQRDFQKRGFADGRAGKID